MILPTILLLILKQLIDFPTLPDRDMEVSPAKMFGCVFVWQDQRLGKYQLEKEGDRDRVVKKSQGLIFYLRCDRCILRWNQSLKEMSLSSMVVHRWPSPIFVVNGGLVQWRFIGVLVPPWSHRHFEMMTKCLIRQDTSSKLRFTLAMFQKTTQKNT